MTVSSYNDRDFDSMISHMESTLSIVGMLDLRNNLEPDWMLIYKTLKSLHREEYENNERILIIVDKDWYDDRYPCGLLLEGIQRLLNLVDISNFFVELITTNQKISIELDYLKNSISTDPVAIHANICQGFFHQNEQAQRARFDVYQIESKQLDTLAIHHHDFLYNNKSACMAPWTHLFVSTDQQVFPCCVRGTLLGDLKTARLEAIWNTDTQKDIRASMLRGQRHQACSVCYINEDAGKSSYRQYINRKMSHHVAKIDDTDEYGKYDKFEINYLHFKFSNLCNLACRTCNPTESSSWHSVAANLGDIPKNFPVLISANKDGKLFQKFVEHLDFVDLIKFTGGEPLMMQEFYDILDLLISKKRTDIELFYNTNMMQLNYRGQNILDLWTNFPKVTVGASIDAEAHRGEYLRSFSKWNVILKNILEIKNQCPHVYFFISATASLLNVLHLPDLHRSLIDQGLIEASQFDINVLVRPTELSLMSSPPELQKMVRATYEKHILWLQNRDKTGRSIGAFAGVLNLMDSESKFDATAFWNHVDKLDRYHHTNLLTTFPELEILPKKPVVNEI